MDKPRGKDACRLGVHLIEEQLLVLPMAMATIMQSTGACAAGAALACAPQLNRKHGRREAGPGTDGLTPAAAGGSLDLQSALDMLRADPRHGATVLRVIVGNALLAVGDFVKEYKLSTLRTPEIQFLGHVRNAVANANIFDIDTQQHLPVASFDGLIIDGTLNGSPLFGDGVTEGFMEVGDAVALLQWLARHLRGIQHFVSGGDAG
jgi:hypothetical protein